jgi:nucleotide-binding universal stress UspA family protein
MVDNPGIVVGFDGMAASGAAVDWAAAEALRRHADMTVVHATVSATNYGMVPNEAGAPQPDFIARAAEQICAEGVERAAKTLGSTSRIHLRAPVSGVAAALIAASQDAELIVVGTHGHGESGRLLGSVAYAVTAHARCPVVVVRGESEQLPGPGRPVLAGVDGSAVSLDGLRSAAAMAVESSAQLIVLSAYPSAVLLVWSQAARFPIGEDGQSTFDSAALHEAQVAVQDAAQMVKQLHPSLAVEERVTEGPAAAVLATASMGCGLVVVGSHGRGAIPRMLLGSVTHKLIQTAECPVMVVR